MLMICYAAHPMLQCLAQGACQPLDDGRVLQDAVGRELGTGTDADGWLAAAEAFNRVRAPRTARFQHDAHALR